MELLIELKDGGVKDIYTDTNYTGGCSTCDWGSSYVNEFIVYLTKSIVKVEIDNTYRYAVSDDYLTKLFLKNIDEIKAMTENEFYEWIENKLMTDFKDAVNYIDINRQIRTGR